MAEWTQEARDYLDGYLGQVSALRRDRGPDGAAAVSELGDRIRRDAEDRAGALVTIEQLRGALAGFGTPEQAAGVQTADTGPLGVAHHHDAPLPPPIAPPQPASQTGCWIVGAIVLAAGAALLALLVVFAVVAAIAIPNLLRSRIAANEAAAIGALRMLTAAQVQYHSAHGEYATELAALYDPNDPRNQYIDRILASGTKSGYRFEITSEDPSRVWQGTAEPLSAGESGIRTFTVDESGIICADGKPI